MLKRRRGFSSVPCVLLILILITSQFNTVQAQTSAGGQRDFSSFRFGGFLQQQFVADQTADSPNRFSIHRARLGVTGSITDRIRVNLIGGYVEPPDRSPGLVNAFVDFDIHPLFQVRTGQFLLPFGLEGPEVIIFNPAVERTTAILRLNTFTMFRDIGVQIGGRSSIFNYRIALVNGRGANQAEQFDPKDVLGRVGVTPFENFELGISAHLGQYQPVSTSDNHENRFRAGVDISFTGDPLFFRGEYIMRGDDLSGGGTREMNGWYLLGGYKFAENFETITRYEYYEPDTSAVDNQFSAVLIGVNYYFVGNTRLSVNYEFRDDKLNSDLGSLLTAQMQIAL